jgi:TetR/AcrR family transcriptional repressor of bet genes
MSKNMTNNARKWTNYEGMPLRIIESTLEIVGELGLENLTIRKVSEHAGISVGIVHHHFENKANLVYKTYDHLVRVARHEMTLNRSKIQCPIERLKETSKLCFSPNLMTKGASNVWPQMWSNSAYDKRIKRLCFLFSKRLISNLMFDYKLAGCNPALARIHALETSALIHGLWIEQSIFETTTMTESLGILFAKIDDVTGQLWLNYMKKA